MLWLPSLLSESTAVTTTGAGSVTVTVDDAWHPLASVTWTVSVPGPAPVNDADAAVDVIAAPVVFSTAVKL